MKLPDKDALTHHHGGFLHFGRLVGMLLLRRLFQIPANQLVKRYIQRFCYIEKRLDRRIRRDAVLHLQVCT